MQKIVSQLDRLYNITHIPMAVLNQEGAVLACWPQERLNGVLSDAQKAVVLDFQLQKRDMQHPLISYLGTGFLLGVMQIRPELYVLIGLVTPHHQTRKDILKFLEIAISPMHRQSFCDFIMQLPLVSLNQMQDFICLIGKLLISQEILRDNISFIDIAARNIAETHKLEKQLFEQREEPDFHVPVDFETSVCNAIETGNRTQLDRSLYAPVRGRIGRMSSSELRQQKYSFVCMATLASRAAIRGGLPAETAFSLSDLYCQRIDLLSEVSLIQNMTYTMLVDYCNRVQEIQNKPSVSPLIQKCISYISVHLHEPITLEQLSEHCALCSRSLSLRFKKEMGMGIPEYIHREKLQEAEYLLRDSRYSISEITSFLNYPSQSYFTQIFKKYYQVTPQAFRDRQR